MFGGLALMVTGLIMHAATNPRTKYINEPVPMSLAMCLISAAFVTNFICALRLGKCWGRGGLSDADSFDKGANILLAGITLLVAIRIGILTFRVHSDDMKAPNQPRQPMLAFGPLG